MLVALTGGFGTGKSTVLEMFRRLGVPVLSADSVVHELLLRDDVKKRIRDSFGEAVFKNGEIDRKALARVVFESEKKRNTLEGILHPEVFRAIEEFRSKNAERIAVAEIPLLFETGTEARFDKVIVVVSDDEKVRERLTRKGFSKEEIKKRQKAQMPIQQKKERADFVVENSGGLQETEKQVKEILKALKEML